MDVVGAYKTFFGPKLRGLQGFRKDVTPFIDPDGLKGGDHPVEQQFLGKRGKSVKRMRFAPTEKAYAIGLKLQGS